MINIINHRITRMVRIFDRGNADYTDLTETRGFFNFVDLGLLRRDTQRRRGETQRFYFWNADGTDLAEARGFSTALKIYG